MESKRERAARLRKKLIREVMVIVSTLLVIIWDIIYYTARQDLVVNGLDFTKQLQSSDNSGIKWVARVIEYIGNIPFLVFFFPIIFMMHEPRLGTRYLSCLMVTVYIVSIFKFIHHDARPPWIDLDVKAINCNPIFGYPSETVAYVVSVGLWVAIQFEGYVVPFIFTLATAVYAILMGMSNIYLGLGIWPQLIAGITYGFFSLCVFVWIDHLTKKARIYYRLVSKVKEFFTNSLLAVGVLLAFAGAWIVYGILSSAFTVPGLWRAKNAAQCSKPEDSLNDLRPIALSFAAVWALIGHSLGLAITESICIPGWYKSTNPKRVVRAFISLVVVVLILVLIRELVPASNPAVSYIVRDGVAYFAATFIVVGILPFLFSLIGLAQKEARESPEEIKLTRQKRGVSRIDVFATPVDDIISKKQSVIEFSTTDNVSHVLGVLFEKGIYSAPVWDSSEGAYVGFVDMVDIVKGVTDLFKESEMLGEEYDDLLVERYKKQFSQQKAHSVADISKRNPMKAVSQHAHVRKALKIFANTGVHRVAVIKKGEKEEILNVLTQSAIIEWLQDNLDSPQLSELLNKKISDLDIGTKKVLFINSKQTALEGFKLMAEHKINGIAIVDESKKFVNALSAKDIKVMGEKVAFSRLMSPCLQFVELAQKQDSNRTSEAYTCSPDFTLKQLIEKLGKFKRHRIFVLEGGFLERVISLGDVIKVLIEFDKPLQKDKHKKKEKVNLDQHLEQGLQEEEKTKKKKKKKDSHSGSSNSEESSDEH